MILTLASLIAIAIATLTPETGPAVGSHFCLVCGSVGAVDAVLNIILFVPLGVGLALSGVRARNALVCMFALSVLIETAQFFVISGRDAAIGDVLTNTLGGTLGLAIGRYHALWLRPRPSIARKLLTGWAIIWLSIQMASNYGFALSLPPSKYYGQIARALGNFAVFPGTVLSSRIDGVPIPNTAFDNSAVVEQLLAAGATVTAKVLPAEPTRRIAPIVRITDARQREILLVAQDGDRLIFGVRTGAAVLGARPPLFGLANVFPVALRSGSSGQDTLTLIGRYAPSGVRIHAHGGGTVRDRLIPITASLGWTLWLPFQWLIEGTWEEQLIGWIWIACLAIPMGYWAIRIRSQSMTKANVSEMGIALLTGAAVLFAGLTLVPYAFGVSTAPLLDWLATFGGGVAGYALGRVTVDVPDIGGATNGLPAR
jgi:VanZ like family